MNAIHKFLLGRSNKKEVRWVWHVARAGRKKNSYMNLVAKLRSKKSFVIVTDMGEESIKICRM